MLKKILQALYNSKENRKQKTAVQLEIFSENQLPDFFLSGEKLLISLKENAGAAFSFEDKKVKIAVNGVQYYIASWEELNILHEVYVEGIYNIACNNPFVCVDIGMNVGVTSLFFAAKKECTRVISYEPFAKTFNRAKQNMALNSFSSKIIANNVGLGYPARTLEVDYSEEFKGSVGTAGLGKHILGKHHTEKVQMQIKDVYEAVQQVLIGSEQVLMKIDCEGSEYEILKRLQEMKVTHIPFAYLIEWHKKGPEELKNILNEAGYTTLSFNEKAPDIGMLYAFRTR